MVVEGFVLVTDSKAMSGGFVCVTAILAVSVFSHKFMPSPSTAKTLLNLQIDTMAYLN